MARTRLKTVTRLQGNNAALLRGDIVPQGFELEFEEIAPLPKAFRRMVRGLEFDVCEMALTTYLCAREHGVQFTALPIFLVRAFHHGAILHNVRRPICNPKELEGKRVGVNRGYTVTTGVWARSILQQEYDVDLSKITWVLSGDEHVQAYQPPANVEPIDAGSSIEEQLASGELAAAINISSDNPDFQPMIDDPDEAGLAAYSRNGHYPINHLIAVRNDVLQSHPDAASSLFAAFSASKERYLQQLRDHAIEKPTAMDRLYSRLLERGDDPLPYGVEPNRRVLEDLMAHAMQQQILTEPVELESLFASV